jgi:hypothetical protein
MSTMNRTDRRGSALIITVGTLALIAVFAAFYLTLGQADTRASASARRATDLSSIEHQIAEYIARVVAEDRLSVTVETISARESEIGGPVSDGGAPLAPLATDRQRFVRAATDYPYTDYSYKSVIVDGNAVVGDAGLQFVPADYFNIPIPFAGNTGAAAERFRFRPSGDHPVMLQTVPGTLAINPEGERLRDYRVASDPWLASSEPEFLGRAESGLNIDQRLFSQSGFNNSNAGPARTLEEYHYLDNRDWRQISNLAPDGLSVNLFNLRGNFGAEPGLGTSLNGRVRMSENRTLLTLNNAAGGIGTIENLRLRATDRLHIDPDGTGGLPGLLDTTTQGFALRNTPAWWTMNQRFLHFPADPAFQILGRGVDANGNPVNGAFGTRQTWATPDYPDYQYADADGDGFYDSRWFELTDATLGAAGLKQLLQNETDMRFFIAARVVDLSARVNVNSATDGLLAGTSETPAGATPAEIDLRRLLSMQDVSERYRPVFENPLAGFAGFQRLSFAHLERLPAGVRQADNPARIVAEDYERFLAHHNGGTAWTLGSGIDVGRFAYDAIRREIQGDEFNLATSATSLRWPATAPQAQPLLDSTPFEYFDFTPGSEGRFAFSGNLITPTPGQLASATRWRRDFWHDVGGANIADPGDPPITALGLGGRLFDLDDLGELLAFNGVNDDSRLSRLERVTQGRYEFNTTDASLSTVRYGPLRANRPTARERRGHDNRLNLVSQFANDLVLSDGQIDYESLALATLDPRRRLTTISGAAPLRSRAVRDEDRDGVISEAERRLTGEDARLDLTTSAGDAAALFAIYGDALAPYAHADSTWNRDPEGEFLTARPDNAFASMRTLAYGHRGSELALRISAHLAVNMADLYDDDDIPSAYTVVASPRNDVRRILDTDAPTSQGQRTPHPWWADGKQLDLGDERLAPDQDDVDSDWSRVAYNVFGFEPHPFVTEVAVMTIYCDAPRILLNGQPGFTAGPVGATMNESGAWGEDPGPYPGRSENPSPESDSFGICGVTNVNSPNLGQDDDQIDDVTIQTNIAPDNPDLMLHVLAIQLTNPFDVEINLSDLESGDLTRLKGRPLDQNAPDRVNDIKFYLEFNGHFFPLAEYVENAAATLGNQFDLDGRMHRVVLGPGESRVFYVSAHPNLGELSDRWRSIEAVYAGASGDSGVYDIALSGANSPQSRPYLVEQFLETQLSVRDDRYDYQRRVPPGRLVPFDPVTGGLARDSFVDFMRTSRAFRDAGTPESYRRMRQEVRLWRKLAVEDPAPFGGQPESANYVDNGGLNWIENDLLVDRLRDPVVPTLASTSETRSTLDYATLIADRIQAYTATDFPAVFDPAPVLTPVEVLRIPETTATNDTDRSWSNTNQGITAVLFTGYRRPDHLVRPEDYDPTAGGVVEYWRSQLGEAGRSPRGLLPAWCFEATETNLNIAHPAIRGGDPLAGLDAWRDMLGEIRGTWFGFNGCHREDGFGGAGNVVPGGDVGGFFFKNPIRFMRTLLHDATRVGDDGNSANDTWVNIDGREPLLLATIATHPALKARRVNDPADDDDDLGEVANLGTPTPGSPLELEDPLRLSQAYEDLDRLVNTIAAPDMQFSDKRTPTLLRLDQGDTEAQVASDRAAVLVNTSDRFGFDGEREATRAIRLGDLVLPMGVGAAFAPRLTVATPWGWNGPANFRPGDWVTVGEAMTAAFGFEPPAFYNKDPNDPGYSLLSELVAHRDAGWDTLTDSTAIEEIEFVLDRGRLDLHAYAPFYNQTLNGAEAFFQPGQPGFGDHRVGLSIPPAQRLLSMGRAISRGGDPLTTPVIGTVNINTAPDPVLRTIPGFATSLQFSVTRVDYDQYDLGTDVVSPFINNDLSEWPEGRVAGKVIGALDDTLRPLPFGIGDPFTTQTGLGGFFENWRHRADVPAYLASFRDRTGASGRPASLSPIAAPATLSSNTILNSAPNPGVIANWFGPAVFGSPTFSGQLRQILETNHAFDLSRTTLNGEMAASERPGFDGVGRLLGLHLAERDPLNGSNPRFGALTGEQWTDLVRGRALQTTVDRHAHDGLAIAGKDQDLRGKRSPDGQLLLNGFDAPYFYDPTQAPYNAPPYADTQFQRGESDNFAYTPGRGLFFNENPDTQRRRRSLEDEIVDDILEKLAIFNGAANTVDVRSDFFAAWFVIRGYRESDVTPLTPEQPMTPTYQKRFLMVLDRTNVTQAGQLPRILMLREVPL